MDPSFFKPLVGDFSNKLLIPPAFVERMEGKLGSNVVLRYECEKLYTVEIEEMEEGRFFFVEGWPQFVKDHGLKYGDFIVFRLIEDSTFEVTVYEPSMCEKHCCDSHCNNNVLDQTAFIPIKVETNTTSAQIDLTEKSEETDTKTDSDDEQNPKDLCADAPSFQLLLNEANKMYLPLPPLFVRKSGLAKQREIKLRDTDGKKWVVKIESEGKNAGLTRGWSCFFLAHRLKKGDTCVFTYVRGVRESFGFIQVDLRRGRGRPPKLEPIVHYNI